MKLNRTTALALGLALLAVIVLLLHFVGPRFLEQEYRSFPSPDGRYRVVVFRNTTLRSMMPGQSGDAPGTVRLYDDHGNALKAAEVQMVHLVDRVDWEPHKVTVKFVADWDLPK